MEEDYAFCKGKNKNCKTAIFSFKELFLFKEVNGGYHLSISRESIEENLVKLQNDDQDRSLKWYIRPSIKPNQFCKEKLHCSFCKEPIGNIILDKLKYGNNLYTLDRECIALGLSYFDIHFAKTKKWNDIIRDCKFTSLITEYDVNSPELKYKPKESESTATTTISSDNTTTMTTALKDGADVKINRNKSIKKFINLKYKPTTIPKKIDPDYLITRNHKPHDYQMESLARALSHNTLLVIPTGLGKTLVAILLIQQMIAVNKWSPPTEQDNKSQLQEEDQQQTREEIQIEDQQYQQPKEEYQKRMVLFVVSTNPLVEQQEKAIRKHIAWIKVLKLNSNNRMKNMKDPKLRPDVIVATCDAFINMSVMGKLSLKDFHTVIFDEVHHAKGEHSYTKVMKLYEKLEGEFLPRILGLSASPSIGENYNTIRNNILKIEGVLQSTIFRPKLPPTATLDSQKLGFINTSAEQDCLKVVTEVINQKLSFLMNQCNYHRSGLVYKENNHTSFHSDLKQFNQWMNDQEKEKSGEQLNSWNDLNRQLGDVIRIFGWMMVSNVEGFQSFINHLDDDLRSELIKGQSREFIQSLRDSLFDKGANQCQFSSRYKVVVDKLTEKIDTEEKLESFRGIIFAGKRSTVKSLVQMLKKERINLKLNTSKMIGHGKEDGMDTEKQEKVMSKFRLGQIRLLISTSVLEEGIDVSSCNFVLCFDEDLDVRSLIQRRGRARNKEDGEFWYVMPMDQANRMIRLQEAENLLNEVITNIMEIDRKKNDISINSQFKEWLEYSETYKPIGNRNETYFSFYNTSREFQLNLVDGCLKNHIFDIKSIMSTQETKTYLKNYIFMGIGFDDDENRDISEIGPDYFFEISDDSQDNTLNLTKLFKTLYKVSGWWARITNPSLLKLPDESNDQQQEEMEYEDFFEDYFGDEFGFSSNTKYYFTEECNGFSCGNMITPTIYRQNVQFNDSYLAVQYGDSRQIEITINNGNEYEDIKLIIKNEDMENYILYDCNPNEPFGSLYIIAKRPPVAVRMTICRDFKARVCMRYNSKSHPFLGNSYVYCIKMKTASLDKLISVMKIQYYLASIITESNNPISTLHQSSASDKDISLDQNNEPLHSPITLVQPISNDDYEKEIAYLFAVLNSNTKSGFGKNIIPMEFFDYISNLVKENKKYAAEYLIQRAIESEEFADYQALMDTDIGDLFDNFEPDIPVHCFLVKSAFITPSRFVFNLPRTQLGNRCIRVFPYERFLSVQFTEEDYTLRIDYVDHLMQYYREILFNGIYVPGFGRFYFVGSSNSQARCLQSWFYCVEPGLDKEERLSEIRDELIGTLIQDWNARKVLRALSLIFPSTVPTIYVKDEDYHENIEDIVRNDHIFTEGCGYVGRETGKEIAEKGGFPADTSAFQVRIGGNKGVLSVHPEIERGVYLRKSMNKFKADKTKPHNRIVEVISVSGRKACHLNRQIINLLSGLGVPDGFFLKIQEKSLDSLAQMFRDESMREHILHEFNGIDEGIDDLDLAANDPLIANSLQLCYLKKLDRIQDKCMIPIDSARTLLGISDESGQLEEDEVFIQISNMEKDGHISKKVITGPVFVCKNPCLHPGDIRVLKAVDNELLKKYYCDVIAFSQNGRVPKFKECSGSDLDGDRYFVGFDQEMIKFIKEYEPFLGEESIAAHDSKVFHGQHAELVDQYLVNIQKGCLGRIALSHLAICDKLSPTHELAIELSKEHFKEVDSIKTGIHGKVPKEAAKILKYFEEYPHFMESAMPKKRYWISTKVLGKLYQINVPLRAIPRYIPETFVDEANLFDGYEVYYNEAKSIYNRYKCWINLLLQRYDIDREEDVINEFIKETINSVRYSKLVIEELKHAYQNIQSQFRDEFINGFYGSTLEDKKRINSTEIKKKVSAWYKAAYSDASDDRTLTFYWCVKHFQPKRHLTTGFERPDLLSDSIIDFLISNQTELLKGYSERLIMIRDLTMILNQTGSSSLKDSKVLLFGSSSMLLFDPTLSDLDLFIDCDRNGPFKGDHHQMFLELENALRNHESKAESIEYVQKSKIPIIKFQLNKIDCDIAINQNGIEKTALICQIYSMYPFVLPVLYVVIRWGRETGIITRQLHSSPSRNMKTWTLVWMVIHFFIKKKYIDHVPLNFKIENKSVEWFTKVLVDASKSKHLAKYLIEFFQYYSSRLAQAVREKKSYSLYCPLDEEQSPSLDFQPDEINDDYLVDMFNIGYHTLCSSPGINDFLKRCQNDKTKVVNLDKVMSRHIAGSEMYLCSKIKSMTNANVIIQPSKRGCLQIKISGDPHQITKAMEEIYRTSSDITSLPSHCGKSHVPGGGTVLLFKGCNSTSDMIKFTRYNNKDLLFNIQHRVRNPKMKPLLKHPYPDNEYSGAKLVFNKTIWQQLDICHKYVNENLFGKQRVFIRFGNIYLFHCPYEGAEDSIEGVQKSISKTKKKNFQLIEKKMNEQNKKKNKDKFEKDLKDKDEEENRRLTILKEQIPRTVEEQGEVRDKTKIPKSSFYTNTNGRDMKSICSLFESIGWTQCESLDVDNAIEEGTYTLCCNLNSQKIPEFKICVKPSLQPPNSLKDIGLNWFVCDLSDSESPDSNKLDIRYCIQSKKHIDRGREVEPYFKEFIERQIVQNRNGSADSMAPIVINQKFSANVFLIRHHKIIKIYRPPEDHPLSQYHFYVEIHEMVEYKNNGVMYSTKIEIELSCNLPSIADTCSFTPLFWDSGLDILNHLNK